MEVILSGEPDDNPVLEAQSRIETSNDRSDVEAPMFRLPTELTMLIFRHCSPKIEDRLVLTHTCRRWRCIAINDASLWTRILVETVAVKPNVHYFLSLLGMQLDRTANLLLDVELYIPVVGNEFAVGAFHIMREKAPICRWRTLDVQVIRESHPNAPWLAPNAPWSTPNTFTNLESLRVVARAKTPIISAIDRAITSRLKFLEVDYPSARPAEFVTDLARALTFISSLRLDLVISHVPFLPANVVNLELDSAEHHPFPHVQTYTLSVCRFTKGNSVDLRNMTILIVERLTIMYDVQVSLPALQKLKLGGLRMHMLAEIKAPTLDILYFTTPGGFDVICDLALLSETHLSLQETGYLLSPNTLIVADSYWPSRTLIQLLANSPKVMHATLRFNDWSDAKAVLERLVRFKAESESDRAKNPHLCPRLSELRLDFGWGLSAPSASKKWLLNRLKSRKEAGSMPLLSIYARWKRERTFVLLTGD